MPAFLVLEPLMRNMNMPITLNINIPKGKVMMKMHKILSHELLGANAHQAYHEKIPNGYFSNTIYP